MSAREQAERRRDFDLREILGMGRLWVVDAAGKRLEPAPNPASSLLVVKK